MNIGKLLVLFKHVLLEHAFSLACPVFLGGQTLAALVAAAGKYVAAAFGAHSFAEAVHFASVSLFGLIGS